MVKIAVIYDGNFGKFSYESLKDSLDTELITIKTPSNNNLVDEIEISNSLLKKIATFDIVIMYIQQPDFLINLVSIINNKVSWIIIGIWNGDWIKSQLTSYHNVIAPENNEKIILNTNNILKKFTEIFEFSKLGRNCQGAKILEIREKMKLE